MLKIYRNLKPFTFFLCGIIALQFLQVMANLYLPTLMSNIINDGVMAQDINYIWKTAA